MTKRFLRSELPWLMSAVLVGCAPAREAQEPATAETVESPGRPGSQAVASFSQRIEQTLETHYLLFLPSSYDDTPERTWPLIVHLHGGGGRGTDIERLRPYPLVQRLDGEPDFPFVVVSPQCPPGRPGPLGDLWTEHADLVFAVLDEMRANYRIDDDRIYLVGHSMGGNGVWYLAHRQPERFAAIAPISGPGIPWWTYRIAEAGLPVWVLHGALDEVVPVAESERMVEALQAAGGNVRFTSYPEGGHALREPFESDAVFDWMLAQRRQARTDEPAESR